MRKWILSLAVLAAIWPGAAAAQAPSRDESLVIRINADAVVAEGETVDNLVVISADALVEGTVTGSLLVIDGDARVSGSVGDDVTVISGDVHLLDGATVNNVHSIRGDLNRSAGATVTGNVEESDFTGFWAGLGVLSVLLWIGMTVAFLVAAIVFALIGGRQLRAAAGAMTAEPAGSIVTALVVWIGFPILAVLAIVTVIGLPLGLGILIFLLPVLGFLGYLVAATRAGSLLTSTLKQEESARPVLGAVLGVVLFQLVILVPIFGALLVFLASLWGAGALAYVGFKAARGQEPTGGPVPPAATA